MLADFSVSVDVFIATNNVPVSEFEDGTDVSEDLSRLEGIVEELSSKLTQFKERQSGAMNRDAETSLDSLLLNLIDTQFALRDLYAVAGNTLVEKVKYYINKVSSFFKEKMNELEDKSIKFIDAANLTNNDVMTEFLRSCLHRISTYVFTTFSKLVNVTMSEILNFNGFGIRGQASLKIFNIIIGGVEVEIVYSIDHLRGCSKFQRAYSVLEGERAIRIYFQILGFFKIHPFIRLREAGHGVAVSLDTPGKMAAQLHAKVSILGINIDADTIITNKGLYMYIEGKIWNVCKATINVTAEHWTSWENAVFSLTGKLGADANGDGNFDDSYLDALKNATQHLADEAETRLSSCQDGLTAAQNSLTSAQNWLSEKQAAVYSANSAFDAAVAKLENAKEDLERAKGPFQRAVDDLNEKQRDVDNLCRIKTCEKVCVPGLSCDICWKKVLFVNVPYPCCETTRCMTSIPDLVCETANLGCKALRGVAYAALEVAKLAVKAPMAALDVAKAAVSAAQFVVDKSRVVLDVAVGALELAKGGLEGAKLVLEGAKFALEAVKQVVKYGVKAINLLVTYTLQSLFDVRNCGFELRLSVQDEKVFNIHCEVNAFQTGFKKIELRINFSNFGQSIWYAAKATVKILIDSFSDLITGRKRREIQYRAIANLHSFMRETKTFDPQDKDFITLDDRNIDVISNTTGFRTNNKGSDYQNRKEIFETKCNDFKTITHFFGNASLMLLSMTKETAQVFKTVSLTNVLQPFVFDLESIMTIEKLGIDVSKAQDEFGINRKVIIDTLDDAKIHASDSMMISEIKKSSNEINPLIRKQIENANKFMVVSQWISAMNNLTEAFFDKETCVSFIDCAHHSITILYEQFGGFVTKRKNIHLSSISKFEDTFLSLISNFSHTIEDAAELADKLDLRLNYLKEATLFCSKPPLALSPLKSQIIQYGATLNMTCNVTGEPFPTIQWYKDDEVMTGRTESVLTIKNVSRNDAGRYRCAATNIVTTLVFSDARVRVIGKS